jgi:hypothetical protein
MSFQSYSQQIVCYGETKIYTVDGPSGTPGSTYTWSISGPLNYAVITGQGTNSISINWMTTPANSYTLKVREKIGTTGCEGLEQTLAVTIINNPVITIPVNSVEVCSGLTNTVAATLTSGTLGGTYEWTVPVGVAPPGNTASFLTGTAGGYSVKYTDLNNCASASVNATVTVNPLPSAVIIPATGASTTFCAGSSVVLSAPATLSYYTWKKDGVAIPLATSSTYTASSPGDYTVTTEDAKGCTATTAIPTGVTVNPLPIVSVTAAGPLEFCSGSNVSLAVSLTDPITLNPIANVPLIVGNSYEWKNDLGTVVGTNNSVYSATTTQGYNVKVTDSNFCSATSTPNTVVTVRPNPAAVISPSSSLTFCAGESVILSVVPGTNFTYQWSNTTGSIPSETLASYTANSSSSYSVKVIDGTYPTNCFTVSVPVEVIKNDLPVTSPIGY